MRNKFDEQLKLLNDRMMAMCYMIEKAIQDAMNAFFKLDVEEAKRIMKEDDLVDREQKNIENICFSLLIQQQPVARDLRTVTAAMKMVTDMERIGDHAADISELTVMVASCSHKLNTDRLKTMACETMYMLIHAVEAYVERDMKKAQEVIEHDDIVDDLFLEVKAELIKVMQNNSDYAELAADLLMVNKYLERIGDHATNIAEWVIFSLDNRVPSINEDVIQG